MIWSAAASFNYPQLTQLLFETTTLGIPLDQNTFVKVITSVYFDYIVQFDRKEMIVHLYILLANDSTPENFSLINKILQEYIDVNATEFTHMKEFSKKKTDHFNKSSKG